MLVLSRKVILTLMGCMYKVCTPGLLNSSKAIFQLVPVTLLANFSTLMMRGESSLSPFAYPRHRGASVFPDMVEN